MRQVKLSEVSKEVTVVDGKLFFGKHEVRGCRFIKEDTIAQLYVIRFWDKQRNPDSEQWNFSTGFDLVGDKFWVGVTQLSRYNVGAKNTLPPACYDRMEYVEHVMDNLNVDTAGKEWAIFEEEDFEAYQNEANDGEIFPEQSPAKEAHK